nr:hypothetical protein MarQu_296 [Marseillevirus sp.]
MTKSPDKRQNFLAFFLKHKPHSFRAKDRKEEPCASFRMFHTRKHSSKRVCFVSRRTSPLFSNADFANALSTLKKWIESSAVSNSFVLKIHGMQRGFLSNVLTLKVTLREQNAQSNVTFPSPSSTSTMSLS